ncbi:MAG: retroviral-like aspartic protease family protein [Bacteroidales bacterium]|jgi:clan AA aspartic protease (TIGR02281 family)|nr:retroviral-like aspartic protease family protein [Bacteroidales bacterium]
MKYRVHYKDNTLFTWLDLRRKEYSASFKFIIDTGSQCTAISENTAYDLGFDVSMIKKTDTIITANSEIKRVGKVILPLFEVFGRKEKQFGVYVATLPDFSGLIGNDFLEKFKRFRIYYDTQEIEVA